ncbi:MAG: hypothetical protein ACFFG0_11520 [Candidatus Thorarchaeota archaeon]
MSDISKNLQSIPPLDSGEQVGTIYYIPTKLQVCVWIYLDFEEFRTVYLLYQSDILFSQFHMRILKRVKDQLRSADGEAPTVIWYVYRGLDENTSPKVVQILNNMGEYLVKRRKTVISRPISRYSPPF